MNNEEIDSIYNEQLYKAELEDLSFLKDTRDSVRDFNEKCKVLQAEIRRLHAHKIHQVACTLLARGFTGSELSRRIRFAVALMADLIARMQHKDTTLKALIRMRAERALLKAYEAFLEETGNTDWRVEWDTSANIRRLGSHAKIVYCGEQAK